jgi:hypothetical protein
MSDPVQAPAAPPELRSLGGSAPPAEILGDLARAIGLPERGRQRFWEALGPCLSEPLPADVEARLDRFCQRLELDPGALARAIKACRFLVRQASSHNLDRAAFAEDLGKLPDAGALRELLLPGYEAARAQVRAELVRATMADHGKLLEGVDWRIDQVAASSHAPALRVPVAVVTMRYREGERRERITFHATPDALAGLRELCDRLG